MTTKPNIELKNIKHTAWASEETHCYQATLYVDGVKWGTVSNQGHGGCDDFYGETRSDGDLKWLNDQIKETYEPYTYGDKSIEQDLDMVCADLVNQWLRDKDFNRAMKSKVLFTKPDTQGVWQLGFKKPKTLWMMLDVMKAKYPQNTYLADLPVDEAKAIYFS
jgi:hypothetical protein